MRNHAKLNTVYNNHPYPVFQISTVLIDRIKINKKVVLKIILTGLIDAFFLVYEPDNFPITKKQKEINLMGENKAS